MGDMSSWDESKEEVLRELETSNNGLTTAEATRQLKKSGKNVIERGRKRSVFLIFVEQFRNWLMIALLIAAGASYFLGEQLNAGVIVGLVIISVVFSFFQEFKAEAALEKLAKYISHNARVKRDGEWVQINSEDLVLGDIVELRIGDVVPAELRLLEVDELTLNESILTGESAPVLKTTQEVKGEQPQELTNMAFMGTIVSSGRGTGVVVSVGKDTFLGKTASVLKEKPPETEFQKQTKKFSQFLFKVILVMTVFVFLANSLMNKGILESFLFAVALAVGITPELLPAIMTITLSEGALRIAKKKVIVKRLMSVEDLGNIDTLCADKTGTLTKGEFSLVDYSDLEGKRDINIIIKALLCTSGELQGNKTLATNPTDKALWKSKVAKGNRNKLNAYKLLDENEFDYTRRRVSALVEKNNERTLVVKGSIESMIEVCKLGETSKKSIVKMANEFEDEGHRVVGVGERKMKRDKSSARDEKNLKFVGFLLFNDPVKSSAIDAIKRLKELGVDIKILSGDSLSVTNYVAKKVGFEVNDGSILLGNDLDKLDSREFERKIRGTNFFARVTPEQKYKIVASLNKEGHVVGFLGDGVNDAPALRAADVGIAVDSGASVSKEAADIILLKKDLHVLADGIETGRKTFGNIMKYILNTISANCGNMLTVSLSSLFLTFIPLLPSQILLNNFISDIPLFAVSVDNVDRDFIKKPKRWSIHMIAHFMIYFGLISSIFDFFMILPMLTIWHVPMEMFRTAWFVESSLSEIIITFAIRTKLVFYKSVPSTLLIVLSILSSLLIVGLPAIGVGEKLFEFVAIPGYLWIWIWVIVLGYFLTTEVVKRWFFKHNEF
jgi:Mg2+-importing ATPase